MHPRDTKCTQDKNDHAGNQPDMKSGNSKNVECPGGGKDITNFFGEVVTIAEDQGTHQPDDQRVGIEVQDLHSITPDRYLETGGGIVHPLSYQQARNRGVPVQGLYVAASGYALTSAGIPRGAVITQLAGEPVRDLADFERRWASLPDGSNVALRYFNLAQPQAESVAIVSGPS